MSEVVDEDEGFGDDAREPNVDAQRLKSANEDVDFGLFPVMLLRA